MPIVKSTLPAKETPLDEHFLYSSPVASVDPYFSLIFRPTPNRHVHNILTRMRITPFSLLCCVALLLAGCGKKAEDPAVAELKAEVDRLKKEKETEASQKTSIAPTPTPKPVTINGQVFIVTKAGTNFKLGLVEVALCDVEQTKKHFANYYAKMADRLKARSKQFDDLYPTFVQEINLFTEQEQDYLQKLPELKQRLDAAHKELYVGYSEPRVGDPNVLFRKEGDYIECWNPFEKTPSPRYAGRAKAFVDATDAAYKVVAKYYWTRKDLRDKTRTVRSLLSDQNSIIKGQMESAFNDIPFISTTKTDADGNFSLKVEPGKPYFLIASSKREIDGSEEKYYWLELIKPQLDADETKLFLSNDNLRTSLDEDFSLEPLQHLLIDQSTKFPKSLFSDDWDFREIGPVPDHPPVYHFFDSTKKEIQLPATVTPSPVQDRPPADSKPTAKEKRKIDTTVFPRDVISTRQIAQGNNEGLFIIPEGAVFKLLSVNGDEVIGEYKGRKYSMRQPVFKELE